MPTSITTDVASSPGASIKAPHPPRHLPSLASKVPEIPWMQAQAQSDGSRSRGHRSTRSSTRKISDASYGIIHNDTPCLRYSVSTAPFGKDAFASKPQDVTVSPNTLSGSRTYVVGRLHVAPARRDGHAGGDDRRRLPPAVSGSLALPDDVETHQAAVGVRPPVVRHLAGPVGQFRQGRRR